ncbi:hypothetical protein ABH935_009924 [Catenulispora sp. GAS73]
MNSDINTLVAALYATVDDLLKAFRKLRRHGQRSA